MDFSQITKSIMNQKEAKGGMFKQAVVVNRPSGKLERHKQAKLGAFTWIIPKQYQFPFNPVDPSDVTYNTERPFVVEASCTEFIIAMKQGMREDSTLHEFYARMLGKTADEYDISSSEVTADDFKIFNPFWYPVRPSRLVQKYTLSSFGQFGRENVSLVEFNEDGGCSNPELLSWQLLQLEDAIVAEKTAEYLLSKNKDKNSLSADDKTAIRGYRESRQISYPYDSGVMLMYEFEGDAEKESVNAVTSNEDIEDHLRYINCGGDFMKKILKRKGKKADKHTDFIELWVTYGDGKATSDKSAELALSDSREYSEVDEDKTVLDKIDEAKEKLGKLIHEGLQGSYVALCKKYVYKFHILADDVLLEAYHDRVAEIKKYVTDKVFNKFIGIIEKANLDVAEELRLENSNGTLQKSFIDLEEIDPLLIKDEEDSTKVSEEEANALDSSTGDTMESLMTGVVEE